MGSSKTVKTYDKIYFIGVFEYTEDNYNKFKQTSSVRQFLEDVKPNAQKDNVNLYFIESNESNYLLTLFDSFLGGEQVIDVIKSPDIRLDDFKSELIYSKS
ncbi:MAG TPA: hypothetical protein VL728_12770 [Cyclobacteriaceae bacterium]|nr:hypothetical protein [Cyclobacteriaceae bacterium]